jgi:hypothetical protein
MSSRRLARASLYAAVYAALTLAPGLSSLAYGQVQFRVSESLLAFACFDAAAVPGLAVGTALGNIASPMGIVDVVAGSLLTLFAAALMWRLGAHLPTLAMPVVVNGLGVGAASAVLGQRRLRSFGRGCGHVDRRVPSAGSGAALSGGLRFR